jgi:hypothetical protein
MPVFILIVIVIFSRSDFHFKFNKYITLTFILLISYVGSIPLANENDIKYNTQPMKLIVADPSLPEYSILDSIQSKNSLLIPDATFYDLDRDRNYIPWTGRFFSNNFITFRNNSKTFNDLICINKFKDFIHLFDNSEYTTIIIVNHEGKAYSGCGYYTNSTFNNLINEFNDSPKYNILQFNSDIVIINKI